MRSLTPAALAPPLARYAHGVELPPGCRLLRSAGQLGQAADGRIPDSAEAQADICFGNLAAILAEAGMSAGDVFHISAFVTAREDMAGYMRARDRFLARIAPDRLPSSTLLIVAGFTRPEFLVEIELWAAAP